MDIKNSHIDFYPGIPQGTLGNKDNDAKCHVVFAVGDQKIIIDISYN